MRRSSRRGSIPAPRGRGSRPAVSGWSEGHAAGFAEGSRYGWHTGACEAVVGRTPLGAGLLREAKVFFIKEGFDSLDNGILDALQGLVSEAAGLHESEDAAGRAAVETPDLVIVLNGTRFPVSQVESLRSQGVPTALWLVDDPYHTDRSSQIAPLYDYVFTHEVNAVSRYRELGCPNVHYLPLAAGPHIYYPRKVDRGFHTDICFIANAFPNRVEFIDRIAPFLEKHRVLIAGWWWERLQSFGRLQGKIRQNVSWMPPEEVCSFYNGAKIVVNLHRADNDPGDQNSGGLQGHSINPRTYEICAAGAFQLTDVRPELPAMYRPGIEVATYQSPEEFMEKAAYYLEHDAEREAMALRGLRRTREEHTYRHRVEALLRTLWT
ncbi:CgeB family protein [Paenibacillus sp. S-38]|uniref:CgeB family protein n=1 Tax=Paenibacillus sp. S-38 TaxID=3416710 RepID=UPI003CF5B1AD